MRGLPGIALAAAAAVLLAAAPAQAVIRPQKGMAGVRLGMSQTEMRATLGQPVRTRQGQSDFGPFTQFIYPHSITVTFQATATSPGSPPAGAPRRLSAESGSGPPRPR